MGVYKNSAISNIDIVVAHSSTVDDDGFVGITCDWIGDDPGVEEPEAYHPLGFVAVPMDADLDPTGTIVVNGCTVLRFDEADRVYTMALTDPRAMKNLPNWNKGDGAMYAPSGYGNFIRCSYDGTLQAKTADANGLDIYLTISPDWSSGRTFYAPWGTEKFDQTGWHLRTQWGAAVDVGGFSDGGPLAALGMTSSFKVRAAMASLEAQVVKLGPGSGQTPVALAAPLAQLISSVIGAVQIIIDAANDIAQGAAAATPTTPANTVMIAKGTAALASANTQLEAIANSLAVDTEIPFNSQSTVAT